MSTLFQSGIISQTPAHARYLHFTLHDHTALAATLRAVAAQCDGDQIVLGIGQQVLNSLKVSIPGMHEFTGIPNSRVAFPVDDADLWCWVRNPDRAELLRTTLTLQQLLSPAFSLRSCVDAFRNDPDGVDRDLTGYEDGTENPDGDAALDAAIVKNQGAGLDGGSLVAVQPWQHQFASFAAFPEHQRDDMIGRRIADNEELDDAPISAHVKRTAQESFTPEAFILRRSMPWSRDDQGGLYFVSFAHNLDAFEAQLRRMSGAEDDVVDALFKFSQPLTTNYFWCPPLLNGQVDLRALKLG